MKTSRAPGMLKVSLRWQRQSSMQMNRLVNKSKTTGSLDKRQFQSNQNFKVKLKIQCHCLSKTQHAVQDLITRHHKATSKINCQNSILNSHTNYKCKATSSLSSLKHIILQRTTRWICLQFLIARVRKRIRRRSRKHQSKAVCWITVDVLSAHLSHLANIMLVWTSWMLTCSNSNNLDRHQDSKADHLYHQAKSSLMPY